MPANIKDQVRDLLESRNSVETTTTQRDHDKSGYVTDDKPRSIMKRNDLVRREQMLYPTVDTQVVKSVVKKPTVTETVQRFEETRRTEEVERRVQRREKKERRSRHHSSSRHHSGWEGHTGGYQGHRSSSLSRGGHGGGGQETYYRQETTRRQQHNNYDDNFNRGIAHARYGSLSDSLRRGELQYVPNGEVRQSFYRDGSNGGQRMHKSYSTRDVFTGDGYDDRRSVSSFRRGSQQQVSPFVEFPPTLPRRGGGGDYRREEDAYFRPVSKSRSYADWDDAGRAGMGREVRRYDDDMSRLEAEFRDSLLMPMPAGNMNERDHRTEQLPGGYETFNKERHANSGRRSGRDGKPVDFNEATQEYNYKREQTLNDDRRRR
ncbi:Protein pat-12 [Caenorhabditis elegans]|uniref:Isoform g of Protein pat-12 n=1 Tax=Caenorhabditis elegans TaxID=6239 RepID=Q95QA6-7|nr:Protein pat-12 [Caenorhabditis elegans]CCD65373.1 Protein pat-12 [Caenorhabditis elegans]|eukprot:NP_741080.1 Protein pat-12 [Caenorhabditis elegans]